MSCKSFLRVNVGKGLGLAWGTSTCRHWVGGPADACTSTPFPTHDSLRERLDLLAWGTVATTIEALHLPCGMDYTASCFALPPCLLLYPRLSIM